MSFVRDLMVTAAICGRIQQDVTIEEAILMLERGHCGTRAVGETLNHGA